MHRPDPSSPDRNIFSFISDAERIAHGRIDSVNERMKRPTIPQYDSTNFPDEAVPGQIVRDVNDMATLWVYGDDEQWHKIGASEENSWPMQQECLHPQHLHSDDGLMNPLSLYDSDGPFPSTGWKVVIDSSYYRGFYASSTTDGDWIIFICRLGPQGSYWKIQPIVEIGAGQGLVQFEWGQHADGENTPDSFGLDNPENALAAVSDFAGVGAPNFFHSGGYQWDLSGGPQHKISSSLGTLSQMRIAGAVGDVLDSNGTLNPDGAHNMNGGPGIWYLKMTAVVHPVHVSSVLVSRQTVFDFAT